MGTASGVGRRRNAPNESLHATETGISSGLMGHLAQMQNLFYQVNILHLPLCLINKCF